MRKPLLFSAVLSLFLLVPASIIWAQITKSINGTVRYESGMSTTTLSTPNGNVVVHLPQSLSGATITGTVSTEPAGKTEKEKNRNLEKLLKYVVMLDGQKIPLTASATNFDWLTHQDRPLRTPMELLDVSGARIAEVSLPGVLSAPAISNPGGPPHLTSPSNILVKGDVLNVYTDQQFSPGEKFEVTDASGQRFTLQPRCLSAQQAVIDLPKKIVPGEITVTEEIWNHPAYSYSTDITQARLELVDIQLSSPNTNLKPGEKSFVDVKILFAQQEGSVWVHPDIEKLIRGEISIDLKNLNPSTVSVSAGDLQRIYIKPDPNTGIAQIRRTITGKSVGVFSVSATLHEDYYTSHDPFRPQLNVLKTPEDFNAWAKALKKDLTWYSECGTDNEVCGPGDIANIKRVLDFLPDCKVQSQLEECKAVAYSLVQPLNVPKGAAISWGSSYESFKSMINSSTVMTGQDDLPDWDVIQNGLNFIQRVGYKTNDPAINSEADDAGQLLDKCRETVPSATQLEQLSNSLQTLVKATDAKINSDTGKKTVWNLSNLFFDTYCLNKRTRDGIDPQKSMIGYLDPVNKILKVKIEYQQQILNSFHAVPLGNGTFRINTMSETRMPVNYDIRLIPFERTNTFDSDWWAEHLIETILKKDTTRGNIITTSKDSTGTYYVFYKDAKCEVDNYSKEEKTSGCLIQTEWDGKEQKSKPTGRYEKITCYKTGGCKKGTDFCTEAYLVVCITQIYMDANCTKRLKTFDFKHFSCL